MNTFIAPRNSVFYGTRHFNFLSKNQAKENTQSFRRNCLVERIQFKIDEKKLLEAEKHRILLYDYLIKTKKLKLFIKDKNQNNHNNSLMNTENCIKKKKTKRTHRLLQFKKKKKEEKRKQKKRNPNFLIENKYLTYMKYENYASDYYKTITQWSIFLNDKTRAIFLSNYINCEFLYRNFKLFFENELHNSSEPNIDEINVLRRYDGEEVNSVQMSDNFNNTKSLELTHKQKRKNAKLLHQKKELLNTLNNNENKYKKAKLDANLALSQIKKYQIDLDTENDQSNTIQHINENYIDNHQEEYKSNDKQAESSPLDINEQHKLRERVINYTLKTNNKFNLKGIIEYWIANCNNLKEKKEKNKKQKDKLFIIEEEPKKLQKKKNKRTEILKHIYSTPSDAILNIIPFCSKKYTVLTKTH